MKSSIHLTLFTLLSIAPPLVAQSGAPAGETSYASLNSAATRGDPISIRSHMQRGDELLAAGQFEAAAREYVAAVRMHRNAHTFAGDALWKIAETHHHRGQDLLAAIRFDEAADEAEAFGQLELQTRALLEAAIRYDRLDRSDLALQRMGRLERLLSSPFLPTTVRGEVERRIIRP